MIGFVRRFAYSCSFRRMLLNELRRHGRSAFGIGTRLLSRSLITFFRFARRGSEKIGRFFISL